MHPRTHAPTLTHAPTTARPPARQKAAGVPFHCEPQWLGKGTVLTTYARDPDGNVVEFQEILNPKSRMAMTF